MTAITRGEFLRAAGGAYGLLAVGAGEGAEARTRRAGLAARGAALYPVPGSGPPPFRSRPDLRPPGVGFSGSAAAAGDGYLFLGPNHFHGTQAGTLILDGNGRVVWFRPVPRGTWVTNFKVQRYRGQPVLTWWEGRVLAPGYGIGEGVIADSSYREIARVRARRGRAVDLHEFLLTPQGTALITCHPETVPADLTSIGGPKNGQVLESIMQEIDVHSGRLLLEWRSLDHVPVAESYAPLGGPYDYMHLDSIEVTPDGKLLISARHTFALYKLERHSGRVIWRMGGKRSNFHLGPGAHFAWQHDARQLTQRTITLFDDGAGLRQTEPQSRGLVLDVDFRRRSVHLARAYRHSQAVHARAMGSMQTLPDGNVMVGWGNVPIVTEYTADGHAVAEVRIGWPIASYRGFRFPWTGRPAGVPTAAAADDPQTNNSTVYVSWNGATEVASWQVSVGPSPGALSPSVTAPRSGFETAIPLTTASGYATVTALDASGRPLATSAPVGL